LLVEEPEEAYRPSTLPRLIRLKGKVYRIAKGLSLAARDSFVKENHYRSRRVAQGQPEDGIGLFHWFKTQMG
jgi:hypothetical protein